MNLDKVVIIIPTYNEELVIRNTIEQLFQAIARIPTMNFMVLIFDSNSTDHTQAIVNELQKTHTQLLLRTEPQKSGLGSAYLQAMQYAVTELSADIVMEFDADLSHQPKFIKPLLETMPNYDVVIGSRYVKGGSIPHNWAWHRKLLSVLGNYVARTILTAKYKDFTSGFRATRAAFLRKVLQEKFISNHYAYKLQLVWSLHQHKARIHEYPIAFIDREKGVSKLPTNSLIDSLKVLTILRFRETKQYFTMCLIGSSGLLIQCIVYNVLRQNLSSLNAAQFAITAAIINNFICNNRFTFKKRLLGTRSQKLKKFGLFVGYSVFMIHFQTFWLQQGINYFGSSYLIENLLIFSSAMVGSMLSYFTYSRLVWRKQQTSI